MKPLQVQASLFSVVEASKLMTVTDADKIELEVTSESRQKPEFGDKPVKLVVVALILNARKVLICQRRPDQPMALKWEFPGGKIEPGETAEQALARELDEELGIDAKIGTLITRMRHTYRSGSSVDLQFFAVHEFSGEITNRIFNDLRWCDLTDLPGYDFLAADRNLVRDLAAGKLL